MRISSNMKAASVLSKTTYVYGTVCEKLLWLYKHRYDLREVWAETQAKFERGNVIGELAQRLFPDGVDVSKVEGGKAHGAMPFWKRQELWVGRTREELGKRTVFEAAFVTDGVFAAVDVLAVEKRAEKGAEGSKATGLVAYEVKSHTSVTETIIQDCALQYYVISRHCQLKDFFVLYVDESYLEEIGVELGEVDEGNVDIRRLFVKESVLSRILPLQGEIGERIERFKEVIGGAEPEVEPGEQCRSPYECMFRGYCGSRSLRSLNGN